MKSIVESFPNGTKSITKKNQKIVLVVAAILIANMAMATSISSTPAGGDWSLTTTWVGGIVPTSTDDVVIVAGSTVVVRTPYDFSGPAQCKSLTISGTLTMGSGSAIGRRLDIQTSLTINGGGILNQGGNAYHEIFIAGDFINQGTLNPIANSGSLNFTFNGAIDQQINSSTSTVTVADITIVKTGGQLSFSNNVTTLVTNTITLTSGNFLSPAILSATGDFKLSAGTFTTGNSTLIAGNYSNEGANFSAGTGTVTFFGTNQVISGSQSTIFNHLAIGGATSTTINTATTVNGDLVIHDGTSLTVFPDITVNGKTTIGDGLSGSLNISSTAGSKVFNGLVMINNGATWSNTADENIHFGGGITNLGSIVPGKGIYFFETNSQEINGRVNLSIAEIATSIQVTNKGTFTVTSSLQGLGSLVQGANSILIIGDVTPISTLTASASGNTVNYVGVAQSIRGINYVNLGLSGDGVKTLSTSTTSVSGDFSLNGPVSTTTVVPLIIGGSLNIGDGATFTSAGTDITVMGATNIGNGTDGSLIISSTSGTKTFSGLVTIAPGATWDNSVGENPHFQNGIQNNGIFIDGAGTNFFETNSQAISGTISIGKINAAAGITLTNNGVLTCLTDLTVNGTLVQGQNSVLNIAGTSSVVALDATSFSNTVNYTGATQTVKGFNYFNLGLSGSGTKTLLSTVSLILGNFSLTESVNSSLANPMEINGDLFLGNGTTFTVTGFDFTVGGKTMIGSGASGTLNFTSLAGIKTFKGLVTISAGATWNNSTNNSAITIQGGLINSGVFQSGSGVYTFDTNDQSLTGSFTISKVTVNGITLTNTNSLTVGTALSGTGTLMQASNSSLIINGASTLSSISGTAAGNLVTYNSAVPAIIGGSYNDLMLNQLNGIAMLSGNATVNGILTLNNGNFSIGNSNLTIGSSGSISIASPSATSMIIASGTGELRKSFNATGSFIFPIGDNISVADYSPVTVSITSASGFNSGYIGVSVVDAKHPSNASTSDFLDRYWNISLSGITGCTADVTGSYTALDVSGTEANIKAAQLNGSFNQVSNGWKKFSSLSSNTLSCVGVLLSNGQTSAFTGITGANPTVSITGGGVTVCSGTPVSLGANVSGVGTIQALWSPSNGLSATDVVNPTATAAGNAPMNYTLTIFDANGISATDNTTITSQQPTVTVNNLDLCNGSPGTLTAGGAVSYSWSPITNLSAATGASVTATPTTPIAYTVTGTDANNCTNTAVATVTIKAIPAKPTIIGSGLNTSTPLLTSSSVDGNQWFKNSSALNGAVNQTYQPLASGSYTVQVTANGCESLMSDTFDFILTAVESIGNFGSIRLYPVPVDKQLSIEWNGFQPETLIEVRIYDFLGRTVMNQTMKTSESLLDLSYLSSGHFIFQAMQGSQMSTQRFMKK